MQVTLRTSLIPASSAGRPLDKHRVILKKMEKHGGRLGRRGVMCGRRKNACETMVVKQKTEIELREGDDY